MFGGVGADTMTGGDGADTFDFDFVEHSPAGFFDRDVIQDFSHAQGDILDLSFIDANTEDPRATTPSSSWARTAASTRRGRSEYIFEDNTTVVQINTAGGDAPEMEIQLAGQHRPGGLGLLPVTRRGGPQWAALPGRGRRASVLPSPAPKGGHDGFPLAVQLINVRSELLPTPRRGARRP